MLRTGGTRSVEHYDKSARKRVAPNCCKIAISNNVGGVERSSDTLLYALIEERHFALRRRFAHFQPLGSLLIAGVRNSVRSNISSVTYCDHDYFFELPSQKGSGIPNHSVGDLHTRAIGLSRVSAWAGGPRNLVKMTSRRMQNRAARAATSSSQWRS